MFKLRTVVQVPTLTCDAPGCKSVVDAAPGLFSAGSEQQVRTELLEAARHLGWTETPDQTLCPRHTPQKGNHGE